MCILIVFTGDVLVFLTHAHGSLLLLFFYILPSRSVPTAMGNISSHLLLCLVLTFSARRIRAHAALSLRSLNQYMSCDGLLLCVPSVIVQRYELTVVIPCPCGNELLASLSIVLSPGSAYSLATLHSRTCYPAFVSQPLFIGSVE